MRTSSEARRRRLGERIKGYRRAGGMTIEKLGEKARVNKNTIVRLEQGKPTQPSTVDAVCDALGVNPFELMSDELKRGYDYQLMEMDKVEQRGEVVVEEAGEVIVRETEAMTVIRALLPFGEMYRLYRLPGGQLNATILEIRTESEWRHHPGEELLYAIDGVVGVRVGISLRPADIKLEKGKVACFWGTEPHQYYNATNNPDSPAKALSIWIDSKFDWKKDFNESIGVMQQRT